MEKIKLLIKKYYVYVTYIISAGISFGLDLSLFSLFLWLLNDKISASILVASYLARALSSFVNYLINKYKVFKYNKDTQKSDNTIWQYFGLVIINITVSAILVDTISKIIPIYATIIKSVIDVIIFVINFFVQKKFIFNENKNNKVFNYILPIISFLALYLKINNNGISFKYELLEIVGMVIVLPLLFLGYLKVFKKANYLGVNILSIVFTLLMILGASYDYNYTPNLVFNSNIHILVSLLKFIGFYFLFKNILNTFYDYMINSKFKVKTNKLINLFNKHPYLFSFGVLFLVYSIYLIIFYPGIINYDNANQIKEVLGMHTRYLDSIVVINEDITLTNFNPILHTLLLGNLFKIGVNIGNVNLGLFLYSFLQMIAVVGILSYALKFLHDEGVKSKYLLGILLIYVIVPYFPLYAITCVKDTLFTMFVLLYVIKLYQFIKYDFKFKDYSVLMITILLVILFRNNGIYLILLSLPFTLIIKKRIRKQILLMCVLVIGFNYGYGQVLSALEIPNTSIREMLSIPFQQTARYVKYHGSDVTEEEKDAIDTILTYDTLADRYNPILSDKVKNEYNKYATDEELMDYFASWFQMFWKHPMTYVNATVSNVYGYFYPATYRWYVYNTLNEKLPEAGFDYHFIDALELARGFIQGYSEVFKYVPVVQLSVNCGFYTWSYLFLMVVLIMQKKFRYIILLAPAFSLVLMNVAGPANTYFRYVLPYAVTLFTILPLILLEINKNFKRSK